MIGSELRSRLAEALRAFLSTYRLEELQAGPIIPGGDYRPTFRMFSSGDETMHLQYRRQEHDNLLRVLQDEFPDQLDRSSTTKLLVDACQEWVLEDGNVSDSASVRTVAEQIIASIEESISTYKVLVPLDGFKLTSGKDIELGRGFLHRNTDRSELALAAQKIQESSGEHEIYEVFVTAPAFYSSEVTAQHARAISNGVDYAGQGLDILRLFIGSHYFQRFRNPSTIMQMGLAGSVDLRKDRSVITLEDSQVNGDRTTGGSFSARHLEVMTIEDKLIREIRRSGLDAVSRLVRANFTNQSSELSLRIQRAISWFAKGVTASSLADAFLLFAISIEALLSQNRTPQSVYARWLAGLLCRGADWRIHPLGGATSKSFGEALASAKSRGDRYFVIEEECLDLFRHRNRVAHGSLHDEDIDPVALLDMETISRNAILSFVDGRWQSLHEYSQWLDESVTTKFKPAPLRVQGGS